MIVPMVVAKREDYLKIFLIATSGSVLGGLFGYMLGVFFLDASMVIIEFYGYEEKVFEMQDKMSTKGGFLAWLGIMFLAGFTPLPFKVFTITSGVIAYNLPVFFFICLFTRGLRFFLVSYLTYLFGKKFGDFIEKRGALWFTLTGIFIVVCILAFSFLSLAIAYFIQYILGHEPCNLCLIERIPYLASLILISLIFIINKFEKLIAGIVLLFFIFGSVVSFYHVGIEQGFFNESFVCDLGSSNVNMSKEDLLKQLQNKTPISCKDVTFRFFGLSLATINTVISVLLSGIMIKVIKNYGKN